MLKKFANKASSSTELPESITQLLTQAKSQDQTIVLATGVFDLLHVEHEKFLRKAKAVGDLLIVGIESDVRVTHTKGPGRPINSEVDRAESVEALKIADGVFILPDAFATPAERRALIQTIRPNILAVSANSPYIENKQKLLAEVGGEVKVVHEHNPAISTTILLEKLDTIKA